MAVYDYPGEYVQTKDGEAYARARIEELQVEYERVQGQANARGLAVGNLFELTNHPRQDQNREYLIVSATYEIESDAYASTSVADAEEVYSCSFTAIDSKQPYRPARTTPKPMVQGPQTATVVGPSGDEIYTDQYGRIKVRFHWDHQEGSGGRRAVMLDSRSASLGWQQLGRHAHSTHRTRSDCRVLRR